MYTVKNYRTKAEMKRDVAAGVEVRLYSPGLGSPRENGTEFVEGPHYPKPHTWYAEVQVRDGVVVKVK